MQGKEKAAVVKKKKKKPRRCGRCAGFGRQDLGVQKEAFSPARKKGRCRLIHNKPLLAT